MAQFRKRKSSPRQVCLHKTNRNRRLVNRETRAMRYKEQRKEYDRDPSVKDDSINIDSGELFKEMQEKLHLTEIYGSE